MLLGRKACSIPPVLFAQITTYLKYNEPYVFSFDGGKRPYTAARTASWLYRAMANMGDTGAFYRGGPGAAGFIELIGTLHRNSTSFTSKRRRWSKCGLRQSGKKMRYKSNRNVIYFAVSSVLASFSDNSITFIFTSSCDATS